MDNHSTWTSHGHMDIKVGKYQVNSWTNRMDIMDTGHMDTDTHALRVSMCPWWGPSPAHRWKRWLRTVGVLQFNGLDGGLGLWDNPVNGARDDARAPEVCTPC